MGVPTQVSEAETSPDRGSGLALYGGANDRFKAGWERRLFRCVGFAAVLHLAFLFFWPSWEVLGPYPEFGSDGWPIQLVTLMEAAPASSGSPAVVRPALEEATPSPDEGGEGEESGVDEEMGSWEWDEVGPSQALRERLELREPPVATVVESDVAVGGDDASASEDAALRIGGRASATDELASRMDRILDMDRLSATRPELALFSPSSVFLLRNPDEVDAFLKARIRPSRSEPGTESAVGVAIWIDESGAVEWAEISQSSGRSEVDELALELFNDVVAFHPARERGVRVPVSAIFWLTFPW